MESKPPHGFLALENGYLWSVPQLNALLSFIAILKAVTMLCCCDVCKVKKAYLSLQKKTKNVLPPSRIWPLCMSAEYSEGDCGSSRDLVSSLSPSLSRSLCLRTTVSSVGMRDGRQGLSTHIRPRAPLIPIIHKFSQKDLYPPSALQCLLSLPPTSLWPLVRNEMSQCICTQTRWHFEWWWQLSVSSTQIFFFFYLLCLSFFGMLLSFILKSFSIGNFTHLTSF